MEQSDWSVMRNEGGACPDEGSGERPQTSPNSQPLQQQTHDYHMIIT